jgi:predicted amidophosphoribosyltransferase
MREFLTALLDLVLPASCGGCEAAAGSVLCPDCAAVLAGPPQPARPTPAPVGLPPCRTGGPYTGVRREALLNYKERGRRGLAGPLARSLAAVVASGLPTTGPAASRGGADGRSASSRGGADGRSASSRGGADGRSASSRGGGPVVLVPVPATAAAIRARYGDHMLMLARRCVADLRRAGVDARVATPLWARPRPDSARLDRFERAAAARHAFAPRWPAGSARAAALRDAADAGLVVVLDDILTTGSTVAAVAAQLAMMGAPVAFAATLAAAQLRRTGGED